MKILHRIAGATGGNADLLAALQEIPVDVVVDDGLFVAKVYEHDARFAQANAAATRYGGIVTVYTTFSTQELSNAPFVRLSDPGWHNGFPQPEDTYESATYDLTNACNRCGIGRVQKAPFRVKRTPSWGARSVFQLHWIVGEFFVPREVWEHLFKPYGIGMWPVLLNRDGSVIPDVVQLKIDSVASVDMDDSRLNDVQRAECSQCGQTIYNGFFYRGYAPRPSTTPSNRLFKSAEYVGYGHSAGNLIYIDRTLYEAAQKLKGVTFQACAPPLAGYNPSGG